MTLILDGKLVSKQIREEVAEDVQLLIKQGVTPKLTVVLVGDDAASQIYVKSKERACAKAGIISETIKYPSDVPKQKVVDKIKQLNNDNSVHGILVQLPLPEGFNESEIIELIAPEKDVDGFHPINSGRLTLGVNDDYFVPATPAGIIEILKRYKIDIPGKHVVIVGRSSIVGKPAGMLFLRHGNEGDATVTFCHSKTKNLPDITKTADILVAATGKPKMITADMVKPGVVVIDVGINRIPSKYSEKGYEIVGDVDFYEVSKLASAITPVPGGIGPMTIAMLLKNTLRAVNISEKKE